MDWYHEVSTDWLEARKDVVTATELVDLRAGFSKLTKDQKAGREPAPAFAALWGRKHSRVPVDPTSRGMMARGHFLEPYAVRDFNEKYDDRWFHWDDCIICNDGLGFSPDAMDMEQKLPIQARLDVHHGKLVDTEGNVIDDLPSSILEIKSYDIEAHMKNCVTDKKKLKERYQIAAAFMVIPTLEEGFLVQYCPRTDWGIDYKHYVRKDLEDEMEELYKLLEVWHATCRYLDAKWQPELVTNETEQELEGYFADFMDGGPFSLR